MDQMFHQILVCVKSGDGLLYKLLADIIGPGVVFFENGEVPPISRYSVKCQRTDKLKRLDKLQRLIVFDDLVLDKAANRAEQEYYIKARKLGFSMCYISQSYFQTPKMIRDNCQYFVLGKNLLKKDLRMILNVFQTDMTLDEFSALYNELTTEPLSTITIDVEGRTHYEGGSTFRYRFGTSIEMGNIDIALGSAPVWYSCPNITATQANNTFRVVIYPTSTGSVTLNVTVPDGGYEISDLNKYLKRFLITQEYFIQNVSGDHAELRTNASTYSVEFVSYPLPTSLPAGFTAGSSITFPTTSRGCQLIVLNNNFTTVIGFAAGIFPAATSSTSTPILSNVSNVIITLDSVSNLFAPNSKVIHSMSPAGTKYGQLITSSPNKLSFAPQQQGFRQELTIQLCSQLLQPLNLLDSDVTIKLLLRTKI